jgi:Leucine-rich repeat (LRR) protein
VTGSKRIHNEAGKKLGREARRLYTHAVKLGFKKEADEGLLKTLTKLRTGVSGTVSALILLEAAVLPDLETILLESPDFSQINSSPIANCQHLKYLYVSGGLTDKAFATLFQGAKLENLTDLWLDSNNLTDNGMSTLATAIKSKLMASIESLNMSQNQITGQGANP